MELGLHPKLWVICAAYNEAPAIGRVVTELRRAGYKVVVVDDGSTDGTGQIASRISRAWWMHSDENGRTSRWAAAFSGSPTIFRHSADGFSMQQRCSPA